MTKLPLSSPKTPRLPRIALHLAISDGKRRLVDPADIYWLEADGDDTWVRLRGAQRLRDRRTLGVLAKRLEEWSFIRIHRSHAVNPLHVLEVRHRDETADWEVKLAPPVNRVLAVSEGYLAELWRMLGES